MTDEPYDLGRLLSSHGTSTVFLQRAAVIAVLSFVFFVAMLVVTYVRAQIGFFVLASAFLVLYLVTMIGIWLQRRETVKLYQHGIAFKRFRARWEDIESVEAASKSGITIKRLDGETVTLNPTLAGFNDIAETIRQKLISLNT